MAADGEVQCLESGLADEGIDINLVSRDEHVPELERHIRTLKERCRSTYNSLPFQKIPYRMLVELVYGMNFWLNSFPAQDGVSATMSPREIITGVAIVADKHCFIPYGAYAQIHEDHDDSMESRTVGAIALRPSGNARCGNFSFVYRAGGA